MSVLSNLRTLKIPRARYLVVFLLFVASIFLAALFSNINFAWVCMVYKNHSINDTEADVHKNLLHWGPEVQEEFNMFFGALTALTFIPMGAATQKFGGRLVMFWGLFVGAGTSVLIPLVAQTNSHLVTLLRSVFAVTETVLWPTTLDALGKWWPAKDAPSFMGLTTAGYHLGIALTMLSSGLECHLLGWESAFYAPAVGSFVFCLMWLIVYQDDPQQCFYVTEEEKLFLRQTAGVHNKNDTRKEAIPWKCLLTSSAIWTSMLCNFSYLLSLYSVIEYGPTYLHDELGLKDTENGFFSTLPYIGIATGRCLVAFLTTNWPIRNQNLSVKFYNSLSFFVNAACLISLAILPHDQLTATKVVAIQSVSLVASGFAAGGFMNSNASMVPKNAAVISSMTNAAAGFALLLLPYLVVELPSWSWLFCSAAALELAIMVVFLVFGKGEVLSWAKSVEKFEPVEIVDTWAKSVEKLEPVEIVDNESKIKMEFVERF